MGDFPLADSYGHVYNQRRRARHSRQLVPFSGRIFRSRDNKKTGKSQFTATLIPNRGAWLEYEIDK